MKMFRRDEGFTLVELMVVVLIIGILVAIAIPVFNAAKANAQTKACFANERTVEGAARAYEASTGLLPGSDSVIGTCMNDLGAGVAGAPNPYLKSQPICPANGGTTSDVSYSWVYATGTMNCSVGTIKHAHF